MCAVCVEVNGRGHAKWVCIVVVSAKVAGYRESTERQRKIHHLYAQKGVHVYRE